VLVVLHHRPPPEGRDIRVVWIWDESPSRGGHGDGDKADDKKKLVLMVAGLEFLAGSGSINGVASLRSIRSIEEAVVVW
jgi:hypothetical protein